MANTITGKILRISPTVQIPSKDGSKTFPKREVVLDATRYDQYTGERGYDNFPAFEFGGEKCAVLDSYQQGQVVTISFDLQGRRWEKDGEVKYITTVRGYKIEAWKGQQQQPATGAAIPQQQAAPQPQRPQSHEPTPQPEMEPLPF